MNWNLAICTASQKSCHCEPVTDVTGVAIRFPLTLFGLPALLRGTDSHASGAPRSELMMAMIAGGNHSMIPVRTGSE